MSINDNFLLSRRPDLGFLVVNDEGFSGDEFIFGTLSDAGPTGTDQIQVNLIDNTGDTIGAADEISPTVALSKFNAAFLNGNVSTIFGFFGAPGALQSFTFTVDDFSVSSTVPVPAALPLMASVIGAGTLLARRRNRANSTI